MEELKRQLDEMMRVFEEFKRRNTQELEELKAGKHIPADIKAQNDKFNTAIDALQVKIEQLQTAMNRSNAEAKEDPAKKAAERKAAMNKYLRSGNDAELKALTAGTDTEGGYFVNPDVASGITKIVYETSPIRQFASVMTISTSALEIMADWSQPSASWVGEVDSRSETTASTFSKITIPVHELFAMPYATQSVLDDASIDLEAWHQMKVSELFGRTEATAFCTGNGITAPKGIASYTSGTGFNQLQQVVSGSAGAFTADGLIDCQNALYENFQPNARWFLARASSGAIRKLVDGNGQYLWSVDGGLNNERLNTLLGKPVHFASDVAAIASDALAAYYGDFRAGYLVVDRLGIRILRDSYSSKPYVIFYTTKRVGGGVQHFQAIKLQKLAAS